jgi:uncharacterized UPF0160 family protein
MDNNTTNTSTLSNLPYNGDLLTAKEKAIIVENWDGEAQLSDSVTALHVAVHGGLEFHADEALGLALLCVLSGAEITWTRTRDPKVLAEADLRVDVGEGLLDHHGARAEAGVAACSRVFALLRNSRTQPREVWEALAPVVEATAATDTGVAGSVNVNPWVHAACQAARARGEDADAAFAKVVSGMTTFVADLVEAAQAAAKAKAAAEREMDERGDAPIVVFSAASRLADVKKMMWEKKRSCIYFISPESDSDWRVLCAADPEKPYSPFNSRRPIPAKFRGLRGVSLDEAAGTTGGIFCHAAGFTAGFATRAAAFQFAQACLED